MHFKIFSGCTEYNLATKWYYLLNAKAASMATLTKQS